jgi:hypothetical protein
MFRRSLAIAIASFGLLATAANADIIVGNFSGTLGSGAVDTLGVFASSGTNLSGLSFSGAFSIDTAQTGPATSCSLGTICERTKGPSPASFLSLTIDGTTFMVAGITSAAALASQDTSAHVTTYQVAAQRSPSTTSLLATFTDPTLPGIPATMLEDISMSGGTQINIFTIVVGGNHLEQFNATKYSLTVSDQSLALAEPPTWIVMFGALTLLVPLCHRRSKMGSPA